mgnify:CR=1 FL=1
MTLTEKIIEEFEKEFCNNHEKPIRFLRGVFYDEQDGAEQIENFLRSSLHQVATEAIEAVRLETKIRDINKGGGQYGHPETDFDTGYNEAILDTEQKAKKFLLDNF